ncbi:hypothetical protein HRbin21_01096 [bacterium HR21]|jgi:predicted short-subunit dehydrogenase-like oxidoreductase (DUF2520 family)|nr:hypothetical protein HRbin21_01096 [bacterium HR21]
MTALPTCGILGPGRLGKTIALALHRLGCLRWVKGRSEQHAHWAALHGIPYVTQWSEAEPVEVLWITVPDTHITEVLAECAHHCAEWSLHCSLVHCAGSLGVSPFHALLPEGTELGAAHPFQTFPEPPDLHRLRCIGWLIESPWHQTRQRLTLLVRALEGIPVVFATFDPHRRVLYHAAAVVASNTLFAVLHLAQHLARAAELPELLFLQPIVQTSVTNFFASLDSLPLTGPVVRGDWETLRRHLQELPATEAAAYRHLCAALGILARREGLLSSTQYQELLALLGMPAQR